MSDADRAVVEMARRRAPVAAERLPEKLADQGLGGTWSLRFGRFGCPDEETRGGIVQAFEDRFIGGDRNFAYRGFWRLENARLVASIEIAHHGFDPQLLAVLGTDTDEFVADCVAEPIAPGRYEGRIRRPGHPDVRVVIRRLEIDRQEDARQAAPAPRHFQPVERRAPPVYPEVKSAGWVRVLLPCAGIGVLWTAIIAGAIRLF